MVSAIQRCRESRHLLPSVENLTFSLPSRICSVSLDKQSFPALGFPICPFNTVECTHGTQGLLFSSHLFSLDLTANQAHAVTNTLTDPTASWNANGTICYVSLYGVHDAPNVMRIDVYMKTTPGGQWILSLQQAQAGVDLKTGALIYTRAGGFGQGFNPGNVIEFYTVITYFAGGANQTVQSNAKSITLPARP